MTEHTILCATDLTEEGTRAVDLAIGATRALSGRLVLIHATDTGADYRPEDVPASIEPAAAKMHERVLTAVGREAEALEQERQRAAAAGIPVEAALVGGRPWEAIVREAADREAALVVVGRRVDARRVGRTVEPVVRRVTCPVFVAPPEGTVDADLSGACFIAGTDFSSHGTLAVRAAQALAERVDGNVVLAHAVVPTGDALAHPETASPADLLREGSIRRMAEDLEALADRAAPGAETVVCRSTNPSADELCRLAADRPKPILVVGTHGRSGLSRLFLGSTTERLLRRATQPVLVVRDAPGHDAPWIPGGDDERPSRHLTPSRILVAVDFSDHSKRALEQAWTLKRTLDASLSVVHVHEPIHDIQYGLAAQLPASSYAHADESTTKELNDRLDGFVADAFGEKAPKVSRTVRVGRALPEILRALEEAHADLLVVGTHGRTGLDRMLLGSTAEKLVRRSPAPVLTVH